VDRIHSVPKGGYRRRGYIGLEMAENLSRRGLAVTVVEMLPQVMPALDPEMAEPVAVHLGPTGSIFGWVMPCRVSIAIPAAGLVVATRSGRRLPVDMAL